MTMNKNYRVLLASHSPRRRELLGMLDIPFETVSPGDVEEVYPDDLPAVEVPEFLARLKASAYADRLKDDQLLITADTVVVCGGKIFGKPHSAEEAEDMLRQLAGRTHQVVTGLAVTTREGSEHFTAVTDVTFAPLTDEEIHYYVERYRPMDKAGAYGIQEWIGCAAVSKIDGSFYNVMGLPVQRLYTILKKYLRPVQES